jgi:hypothetical protein
MVLSRPRRIGDALASPRHEHVDAAFLEPRPVLDADRVGDDGVDRLDRREADKRIE